jgi:hypothetical protein
MTLFLACLIIHGLNLNPVLYLVAVALWLARLAVLASR